MKKVVISGKCNGCGLCVMNYGKYIQEDAEGNAVFVNSTIEHDDLPGLEQMVNDCPEKAMSIMETGNAKRSGREGVKDLIEVFKNKRDTFSVRRVSVNDVKFKAENYQIAILPYSSKEYSANYSSESQAKSAAREEFRNLCYSESAYRPIIKKIFVEYKVRVLRPFYTCEDVENSAYFLYNNEIRQFIKDIHAEVMDICKNSIKLSDTWEDFSVYLSPKDIAVYMLEVFDERSTQSGIISKFKSRGEFTSLNWYVDRMDFGCDEIYAGEGLFGKSRYKKLWYFSGFTSAVNEYIDDLKSSIDFVSDEISEEAVSLVNFALGEFEKKVKEKLNEKIAELEAIVC